MTLSSSLNYKVSKWNNGVFVNEDALIFYHFSGLGIISGSEYNLSWVFRLPEDAVNLIYLNYITELSHIQSYINFKHPDYVMIPSYVREEERYHYIKL
jgi:hypothetical protein